MTDDTERRLRDALRGANLPGAPESLRDALPAMVASPAPAVPRRTWLRALPAIAAVVVLAILAGALTGGFWGRGAAASASPAHEASAAASLAPTAGQSLAPGETPMPTPTVPPSPAAPPTSVAVLDAAGLRAAIRDVQSGLAAAHDVVVDLGGDPTNRPSPATRECAEPLGTCTVVGLLDGFDESTGFIATRAEVQTLPPPVSAADLAAPVALRIVRGGPIELIGHVDLAGASGMVDTAGLKALTSTATSGHVVAVLGWMQSALSPSCGPMTPDDVPNPFLCPGEETFLADTPTVAASSNSWNIPDSAVRVGAFTYEAFAPSPFVEGMAGTPRFGMYLVRMVAVDNADCPKCRGWLAVGRLDAQPGTPAPSASPNAGQRVYSAGELAAALAADRAAFVGKAVIVDGKVTPGTPSDCREVTGSPGVCALGTLGGTHEDVVATAYAASLLLSDTDYPTNGQMAMIVRESGLEYLGWMGYVNGNDFVATLPDLADPQNQARGPETVIVKAWLSTSGPLPCPQSDQLQTPPPDTPFAPCPMTWLASAASPAGTTSVPDGAVRVQYTAYQDYAGAPAGSTESIEGTYLVRLVTDTRQGPNGPRGWQVVARLSP